MGLNDAVFMVLVDAGKVVAVMKLGKRVVAGEKVEVGAVHSLTATVDRLSELSTTLN